MDRKIDDLNPIFSQITRLVADTKSLRFALFVLQDGQCKLYGHMLASNDYDNCRITVS